MTERLTVWAQDSVLRQVFKFYFIILFYVKSDRFTRLDPLNIKNTRLDSQSTKIVKKNNNNNFILPMYCTKHNHNDAHTSQTQCLLQRAPAELLRWCMCWLCDSSGKIESACSEKEDENRKDEGGICLRVRQSRSGSHSSAENWSKAVKYCVGRTTDPNTAVKS